MNKLIKYKYIKIVILFVFILFIFFVVSSYNRICNKKEIEFLVTSSKTLLTVLGVDAKRIDIAYFDGKKVKININTPCNYVVPRTAKYIAGFFDKEFYTVLQKESKLSIVSKRNNQLNIDFIPEQPIGYAAIVIDDVGYNLRSIYNYFDLKVPVTFALLPYERYSKRASEIIREYKYDLILHQPMESFDLVNNNPGKRALFISDNKNAMIKKLKNNMDSIGNAWCLNNHMGSAFTSNENSMRIFLNILKSNNIVFFDSRTNNKNVSNKINKEIGANILSRDIFLDVKRDVKYVETQLRKLMNIALKKKFAVAIGHIQTKTIILSLKKVLDEYDNNKIKIINLKELYEQKLKETRG